jgi:hypothetical protein
MNVRLACFRRLFALLLLMSAPLAGCDSASPGDENNAPSGPAAAQPAQDLPGASDAAPGQHDFARPAVSSASADVASDPAKQLGSDDGVAPREPTPSTSSEIARPIRLTEQAVLPERLPSFRQVRMQGDVLSFELDAADRAHIQVGSVLAGQAHGGYLRRAVAVALAPNGTLSVHTVPAELTELIADGHFVLRAAAVPPRVQAFQIGLPAGLPCTLEATGEVVQVTPAYDFEPELDLEVDIAFDPATQRPVLRYARAAVSGQLTLSATLESQGTLHGHCSADLLAALDPVSWTTSFALGLLPITVRHHLGPSLVVALDLLLEGGVSATASVTVDLSAGIEYACGGWHDIAWQSDVAGDFDVEPTARGTLTASLTPALGYDIELLGLASASVGVRSDLVGRVSADLVECSWEASLDASVTAYAHAHLDLPIVGPLVDIDEERVLWSDNLASDEGMLPAGC